MTQDELSPAILQKLEVIAYTLADHKTQLKELSITLSVVSVQSEKLNHIETQVSALWRKYDTVLGPGGTLEKIHGSVAACPAAHLEKSIGRLWKAFYGAITILVAVFSILFTHIHK